MWHNAVLSASKAGGSVGKDEHDASADFEQRAKLNQLLDNNMHVIHMHIEENTCGRMILQVGDAAEKYAPCHISSSPSDILVILSAFASTNNFYKIYHFTESIEHCYH